MGINLDRDPLTVDQKSYLSKIVNVYFVYHLEAWPRVHTNNFKFKNCLFVKYVYSGYGTIFGSADSWSFDNDSARSVIIFGVDNSSLS